MSVATTSAEGVRPYVSTCADVRDAIAATRSWSALSTAMPSAGSASTSSPFARATASMLPKSSRCTPSTRVMMPTVGCAIEHSSSMCPTPRAPISTTAASVSSGALKSVSGRPSSLLNDFSLAAVRNVVESSPASRSLVDVLPTDPVIPTTRSGSRRRAARPRSASASAVSSTVMAGASTPSTGPVAVR
ncbi:Uncharacterised protein [Mycobacteroides abscessus subsp. abscessus]|nr:Uncharacterised protein [Mycobacteroides abscessus subsp. abscessus]